MVAISRLHGQPAKRRPPRERAEPRAGRHQAIVAAATALFAERGYSGASVQDIADVAGTHKTTVLYHFNTKDALHEAVLDQALGPVAVLMREFLEGPLLPDRVRYMIDQIHAFYAERQDLARLLQRELLEPGGSEAYFQHFVDPIYRPALASLEAGMRDGRIRPLDPALFIHDMHVMLIGYFCHRAFLKRLRPGVDPYGVEALIARREYLVDQIFRALTPETEATSVRPRPRATRAASGHR